MVTELQGQIERITYTNEENGFTIAKVKVRERRDLVTVVGNLAAPVPGEIIQMKGEWTRHPVYGEQFRIRQYETRVPASAYGIEKYLGSGLIKGIGPVMARRIVRKFGSTTLDVIERDIAKLAEVEGIGKKRVEMIEAAWKAQRGVREVMIFLHEHDVSSAHATRIFKEFGPQSIAVVKNNPYRLATEVFGIGFLTADNIARKLGFSTNSELRAEAGVLYVLNQLADEGHVYFPYEPLIEKCRQVLQVDREVIVKAFATSALARRIVIEDLISGDQEIRENHKAVYLAKFHFAESSSAVKLKSLAEAPRSVRAIDSDKAVAWVQKQLDISLAQRQVSAVKCAVEDKVLVITGGPGTGKTTVVRAVIQIFGKLGVECMLAAPTGRAAKRMSEATGHEARTIHRMLEFSVQRGGFQRNEERPLACDLLVVDEASMIDTILLHHLLKAVPRGATFVLVGDVDQLPSVGAGNVLRDIIDSNAVKVVELKEVFRQARRSSIVVNAHRINSGLLPSGKDSRHRIDDFYVIEQEDPQQVLETILELVTERIPGRFRLDPVDDIQVLTPMHRGVVGSGNLNVELQKALNPGDATVTRAGRSFRPGDKIMQIKNNYSKEVFNGDIGRISHIDTETQELTALFDGRSVLYDYPELDEVTLAYAVSVHKAQGSEYPAVIIPLLMQHYLLLQRNLIYTAVTRGRKLVVVVGSRKALAMGVKNDRTQKRFTRLRYRLN
jgi:exodeoxyribonuclease V alpha subunit